MSANENGQGDQQEVQRSKIKVVRNAKGDPQWEVTVIAGDDAAILDEARAVAVAQFRALERELVRGLGAAA